MTSLKAYNMAASITVQLQIFKRPQFLRFSTDLDETGIEMNGLLRSQSCKASGSLHLLPYLSFAR